MHIAAYERGKLCKGGHCHMHIAAYESGKLCKGGHCHMHIAAYESGKPYKVSLSNSLFAEIVLDNLQLRMFTTFLQVGTTKKRKCYF